TGFQSLKARRGRARYDALHVFFSIQLATLREDFHRQVRIAAEGADADGLALQIGGGLDVRPRHDVKGRLLEQPDHGAHGHVLASDKARGGTYAAGGLQVTGQKSRDGDVALGVDQLHV